MNHVCTCKSAKRTLVLSTPGLVENYADLLAYCETDNYWRPDPEHECVSVTVGDCSAFHGITEVVNFLRTLLDDGRLNAIVGAWLATDTAPVELALLGAVPIVQMAVLESGKLLPILKQNRIETFYQPIFSNSGQDLWGYECLMRARDDDGNMISPAQLIGWAQQEQLVFMLDRVCRETHLRNAGRSDIPRHAKLLINFMPTAIYQPAFCLQTTMAAAKQSGIDPSRVIFEVVEQWEVTDRPHLRNILDYYRANGFGVALDDLGSGYSGLSLLADLEPDLIKIDRELISKSVQSKIHRSICASLVRIGHDNGKLVLAEGIETADEMQVMASLGADLFQGYYLGKPAAVPAATPLRSPMRIAG